MGCNARREYEETSTAERNDEMLMNIYQQAIENAQRHYGSTTQSWLPLLAR